MSYQIVQVRLHLLTAVMKCFFKRPPETQKALGAALASGLADFHQVWVDQYFTLPIFVFYGSTCFVYLSFNNS
jgi:hypothetical protein